MEVQDFKYCMLPNEIGFIGGSSFWFEQICGGSIPIVALFEQELGLKSILFGFGLDSDALHSPNENYGLFNFFKGIETIPLFYKHYAELMKWKVEQT